MDSYPNREAAGKILAQKLLSYDLKLDFLVLALPRGGVPVAYEIAKILHAPLDVFIVRKLGVPGQEELAMGALAEEGTTLLNEEIIRERSISPETIKRVTQVQQLEIERRVLAYRGKKTLPVLKDRTIILVDDGIATGATIHAAMIAIKKSQPAKLIVAVPVAEKAQYEKLSGLADQLLCPLRPLYLNAVGSWYDDFDQTSGEEVCSLLKKAKNLAVGH